MKEPEKSVLVIDDEENMRHMLTLLLQREGYTVAGAENGKVALDLLAERPYDLILCDLRMPEMDGMVFLDACEDRGVEATIIMMSAYGNIDTALEAMKRGAYDYIPKPFKPDEVVLTLRKAEERERLRQENRLLQEELGRTYSFENIIGRSQVMQNIFRTVRKVAGFRTSILIHGESGTGKELIARAIHHNGPRARNPFVPVNCGAIPHNLLESELFGYARGAFTDAVRDRKGLFEEAHEGTLFLDEIGELPKELQVKLLRVLQDQEVRPIGGESARKVDVHVISATVKDLKSEVQAGGFRDDLYYRLNVVSVHVPPLRERIEDIPLLVDHFIGKHRENLGVEVEGVTRKALRQLMAYSWPGNVRELENAIERAMVLCEKRQIDLEDLTLGAPRPTEGEWSSDRELRLRTRLKIVERELIMEALQRTGGNRTQAARLLGITHRSLLYKLQDAEIKKGLREDGGS